MQFHCCKHSMRRCCGDRICIAAMPAAAYMQAIAVQCPQCAIASCGKDRFVQTTQNCVSHMSLQQVLWKLTVPYST